MGAPIVSLLKARPVQLQELQGKKLAVDAFNILYQFLSTIRGRDGTQLMDSKGNVTSHLVGLFTRTANLMRNGLDLVFVFDGQPPELKKAERARRQKIKDQATVKYQEAKAQQDYEGMRKYAMRTTVLTPAMAEEAKQVVSSLGLPVVQAPSEGEAQAAHMAKQGAVDYIISQDADSLLFDAPGVVRNLTISRRRKKPGQQAYEKISPELISLSENLDSLGIDRKQLIALAMLVGTDYNKAGIKGVGPKKALNLVKKHSHDFNSLFKGVNWEQHYQFSWKEVFELFEKMPITDNYDLKWKPLDKGKLVQILCQQHNFSRERVDSTLDKFQSARERKSQTGLGEYF